MKECYDKIEELESEIKKLKEKCLSERKFKTGDWVCFNHGEYPEYFSREVWRITHWSYEYNKKGTPLGNIHTNKLGGHDESCLRFAHAEEIKYNQTGLPFIYNKSCGKYELIEINGDDFKIGDLIDTSKIDGLSGKEIITILLELKDQAYEHLGTIFNKLP